MKHLVTFMLCLFCIVPLFTQSISSFIHLDQFGYLPGAEKVAVISDPENGFNADDSYSPGSTFHIKKASDNTIVLSLSPEAWNGGTIHLPSGDRGWWLDFSALSETGNYYLEDSQTGERSAEFQVADDIYRPIMQAAGRMFYYNRCGYEKATPYAEAGWTDGPSFAQDQSARYVYAPNVASMEKDLSGGWFDAGDYNKYVTFTFTTLHDLLWAYRENPQAFNDEWNIHESGNGLPDLLDEIKWELDWLLKMVNEDGSAHIKMGSISFNDNAAAPPSANTDTRYYGPTCSAASIAVASIFAHAAYVFQNFAPWADYASLLEERAMQTYAYALPFLDNNNFEINCDDGSITAGDADWNAQQQIEGMVCAAVHLMALTGSSDYNAVISDYYPQTEPFVNNFWGPYKMPLQDALLLYTTLPGRIPAVASSITTSITTEAQNNWNDFYGFSSNDLYRAQMPDWSYHWGSNLPKANYANLNMALVQYQILSDQSDNFSHKAAEQLHYFHGVNPLGIVYLSNMYDQGAERSVNEIYHTWFHDGTDWDNALTSPIGPPPGYVSGGPNTSFSVTSLSPPANQPVQKSYLDFNTNWPQNSWEISEPAIYYQAGYIRLLAHFTNAILTSVQTPTSAERLSLYPSPAQDWIQLKDALNGPSLVTIWDSAGRLVLEENTADGRLHIGHLPRGTYRVQWKEKVGSFVKQ